MTLGPKWRVVMCADGLQYILQHFEGRAWRGSSFCVSRSALQRCIREKAGEVEPGAPAQVEALPAFADLHGDWGRRSVLRGRSTGSSPSGGADSGSGLGTPSYATQGASSMGE